MSYRLCFIDVSASKNVFFYFTDDFKHQWGDDWRSRRWGDNAGEPYVFDDSRDDDYNANCGHIKIVGAWFRWPDELCFPSDEYSVEDINRGRVSWVYNEKAGALPAGATMMETFKYLAKFNCLYGELKRSGVENDE